MVRDFPQQQGETQSRESMKSLAYVAAIVISMVGLLIVVISNARGSLEPFVFNFVVAAFGVAILALLGFYFVVQPLRPRVENLGKNQWRQISSQSWRILSIASLNWLQEIALLGFIRRYGHLLNSQTLGQP
jgi:O-antigen/teichoic acid export membrane protein